MSEFLFKASKAVFGTAIALGSLAACGGSNEQKVLNRYAVVCPQDLPEKASATYNEDTQVAYVAVTCGDNNVQPESVREISATSTRGSRDQEITLSTSTDGTIYNGNQGVVSSILGVDYLGNPQDGKQVTITLAGINDTVKVIYGTPLENYKN